MTRLNRDTSTIDELIYSFAQDASLRKWYNYRVKTSYATLCHERSANRTLPDKLHPGEGARRQFKMARG